MALRVTHNAKQTLTNNLIRSSATCTPHPRVSWTPGTMAPLVVKSRHMNVQEGMVSMSMPWDNKLREELRTKSQESVAEMVGL